MKHKIKLVSSLLSVLLLFSFVLIGCGNKSDNNDSGFPKHSVTAESTDDCAVSLDKTKAEFAETVTVTLDLKVFDKYVDRVTYNGKDAYKRSETTYDFLMGNDDVVVKVELKPYTELLTDSRGFAKFSDGNTTTLAKNNGAVDLTVALNGSYMTILDWNVKSTNQNVIPGASEKTQYGDLAESGAITASTRTGSMNSFITAFVISIDTDKVQNGETFLLIDLKNGNTSSQSASLVVKLTVADGIVTTKWQENLVIDVSALPSAVRNGKFKIQLTDYDFVSGSDNQEYQTFNKTADDDKIEISVEYVKGHKYYVSIFAVGENDSLTAYKLNDTVGEGSTATGFNQIKNGFLTLLSDGLTFNVKVSSELA